MSSFSVDALERFAAAVLPTAEEEIWRYSRIAELDLSRFTPVVDTPSVSHDQGLVGGPSTVPPIPADDVFDELHGLFSDPIVVRIPAGKVFEEPIIIEHTLTESGQVTFPSLVVEAGENSEATIVQRFRSNDGVVSLMVPGVDLRVGASARISYLGVNELGRDAWLIAHQRVSGARDSVATVANVSLGGYYARMRTDAVVTGIGAETQQTALYFADGDQMHDFRTIQLHDAPKTHSDLLFKGAVHDHSRSVYTGLIKITPQAKGTTAFQTNRNLTLSEGAWAESVPNLEIETNDVKCSHASTVGPVDAEQRFYLESRGVPPEIAEQLIVLGFFDEVIAKLPAPAIRAELRAAVATKLLAHRPGTAVREEVPA